jgi:tripartite ATP-independent transporter DctM subunit
MGLLSLPAMLRSGYDPRIASGTICASGTLGQIIPPSIVLVLLGDVLSSSYQQAQLRAGNFAPQSVSVGDLFAGAMLPGLALVALYIGYLLAVAWLQPQRMPPPPQARQAQAGRLGPRVLKALVAPLTLIVAVLGSIIAGYATPTEAAAVGAAGALAIAIVRRSLSLARLREAMQGTVRLSSMVFIILLGASVFSLVFRGFGGDVLIHDLLSSLPGGSLGALAVVLLAMGMDPVWLGVMFAINLQTSFLTPPFGFALFYLRGVAPPAIRTPDIYRGVVPFILLQVAMLVVLWRWPRLVTWLPEQIYG